MGYSLRYFHLYLFYSFYMCKWSDVTLNESASQFFSGCVLRSGSLDIGDTKTCTRTMRRYCQFKDSTTSMLRYWKFKDIHCSLATASQGALSDRWLKEGWLAARFSSTVGMVWFGHGMVWHGGRYIRRTLVLGGHTIRMGGRRYSIL